MSVSLSNERSESMFTKAQLTAMLNIVHVNTSEALECFYVKGDKLMGTDGFHGFIFQLPEAHPDRIIYRDEIVRYKSIMPSKAIMLGEGWDLIPAKDDVKFEPIDILGLIERAEDRKLTNHFSFNSQYIKNCEQAAGQGSSALKWEWHGVRQPMIAHHMNDVFFVMPILTDEDME